MLNFYFCFKYLEFIQRLRSFFNLINVAMTWIIICECYEWIIAIHTLNWEGATDICVNYLKNTCASLSICLYFLIKFSLMQSIHCFNFENSYGERIDAFTKRSILPLEIWPKRQCHNFDEIASIRLRFFVTFSYEEEFLFLELATFTFSDNESKYILSCRKARPTHSLLNCISHLPSQNDNQ